MYKSGQTVVDTETNHHPYKLFWIGLSRSRLDHGLLQILQSIVIWSKTTESTAIKVDVGAVGSQIFFLKNQSHVCHVSATFDRFSRRCDDRHNWSRRQETNPRGRLLQRPRRRRWAHSIASSASVNGHRWGFFFQSVYRLSLQNGTRSSGDRWGCCRMAYRGCLNWISAKAAPVGPPTIWTANLWAASRLRRPTNSPCKWRCGSTIPTNWVSIRCAPFFVLSLSNLEEEL